jgi:hypothetical protein
VSNLAAPTVYSAPPYSEDLKIRQTLEPLGIVDCVPGSLEQDYEHKILVVNPEVLIPNARNAQNSLYVAYAGFGCTYGARGQAVMAKNLFTGETAQWERSDFLGIVKPESLHKWLYDMPVKHELDYAAAYDAEEDHGEELER